MCLCGCDKGKVPYSMTARGIAEERSKTTAGEWVMYIIIVGVIIYFVAPIVFSFIHN